MISARCKFIYI